MHGRLFLLYLPLPSLLSVNWRINNPRWVFLHCSLTKHFVWPGEKNVTFRRTSMAALVKGFYNDCRFYSHSCATLLWTGNVILMPRLCVSRFLSLLSKAKMLHNYLPCNMFLSNNAFTPASQCQHRGTLDFPAVAVERGMAQLLISSVSSSFSQPKACGAGGGRGWRRRKLKCLLFSPLHRGFYWDGVFFP